MCIVIEWGHGEYSETVLSLLFLFVFLFLGRCVNKCNLPFLFSHLYHARKQGASGAPYVFISPPFHISKSLAITHSWSPQSHHRASIPLTSCDWQRCRLRETFITRTRRVRVYYSGRDKCTIFGPHVLIPNLLQLKVSRWEGVGIDIISEERRDRGPLTSCFRLLLVNEGLGALLH